MDLTEIGIYLLLANVIAHIIQFVFLNRINSSERWGVLLFAFINAGLAYLLYQYTFFWTPFLAVLFPMLGMLGLAAALKNSAGNKWISYLILLLDMGIVILFSYLTIF